MRDQAAINDLARDLWDRWRQGERPDVREFLIRNSDLSPSQVVALLRVDQRERWAKNERVSAAAYLQDFPSVRCDTELAVELVYNEFLLRVQRGESPELGEYQHAYPEYADRLAIQFELYRALEDQPGDDSDEDGEAPDAESFASIPPDPRRTSCGSAGPRELRGYELFEVLGRGGMSVVYRARQRRLNRIVAIKMIRAVDLTDPAALA